MCSYGRQELGYRSVVQVGGRWHHFQVEIHMPYGMSLVRPERTQRLGGESYRTIGSRLEVRKYSARCAFPTFVTPAVRKVCTVLGATLEMATGPRLGRVTIGRHVRDSLARCKLATDASWMALDEFEILLHGKGMA